MPQHTHPAHLNRRAFLAMLLLPASALLAAPARADWWPFGPDLLRSLGRAPEAAELPLDDIIEAVHEALVIATHSATETLAQRNGFYGNPDVRIPLPEVLASARRSLDRIGLSAPLNELGERMNRAAEAAAPHAREPFIRAIFALDLESAREILTGADDAATRYFENHMRDDLATALRPVIAASLEDVQALNTWNELEARMRNIPFLSKLSLDPQEHVLTHTLDGLFFMLAEEETRLRANPRGRGTDVLQRVFRRQ